MEWMSGWLTRTGLSPTMCVEKRAFSGGWHGLTAIKSTPLKINGSVLVVRVRESICFCCAYASASASAFALKFWLLGISKP